jgi:hypothetical protein
MARAFLSLRVGGRRPDFFGRGNFQFWDGLFLTMLMDMRQKLDNYSSLR